ncbi:MAG: ABC transporter ATP-binding protein [Candidatus Latescibacterota bacterium]|nr:ABC transporter ATP-binding protein [Candidatus Latescibacterota bacterium]
MSARLLVRARRRLDSFQLDVDFEAGSETFVLFGASGAGKSSTLNAIAGLLHPDEGEITLDGEMLFRRELGGARVNLATRQRGVGYVFQNYALFPHLNAADNIGFAVRRQPRAAQQVEKMLERMHLSHLGKHYPHELSGGQQQRVAIARALAHRPRLLLLDEPFAALDQPLKERLQVELLQLRRELDLVVLYVTHNLDDAFAMGDRIAVLQEGRVLQRGRPEDVLAEPADSDVAQIMGIRNIFHARVTARSPEGVQFDWDGITLQAGDEASVDTGEWATLYIVPEEVKIIYPDVPLSDTVSHNVVDAEVNGYQRAATHHSLRAKVSNGAIVETRFAPSAYSELDLKAGAPLRLALRPAGIRVLRQRRGKRR